MAQNKWFLTVVVLWLVSAWAGSRGVQYVSGGNLGIDGDIFNSVAWHMVQGRVLYRDTWDHKPPMVLFLNAAAFRAGEPSIHSVRQMERLFGAVAAGLAFLVAWMVARRAVPAVPAVSAAGLAVLSAGLVTMMLYHPAVFEEGHFAEEYGVVFMLAGMVSAVASRQAASRRGANALVVLCGAALGCAVLTKEPFLLTALPWAALAVWPCRGSWRGRLARVWRSTGVPPVSRMGVSPMQRGLGRNTAESAGAATSSHDETPASRDHGRDARGTHGQDARATSDAGETPATRVRLGLLALGLAVPVAAFVVYFLVHGGLRDWLDVIAYNFVYAGADPNHRPLVKRLAVGAVAGLHQFTLISWLAMVGAVLGIASIASREFRRRTRGLAVVAAADLALGLVAASLSGRNYGHYFLQLVPAMAMLAVFGVAFVGCRVAKVSSPGRRAAVAGSLILAVGAMVALGETVRLFGPDGVFLTDLQHHLARVGVRSNPDVIARHANGQFSGFVGRLAAPMSRWEGDALTRCVQTRAAGKTVWAPTRFANYVYPHAGVFSPTPRLYVYPHLFVDTPASTAGEKYQQILHDLHTHPPDLIVLWAGWRNEMNPDGVETLLDAHYELVDQVPIDAGWVEPPVVEVWQRKTAANSQ